MSKRPTVKSATGRRARLIGAYVPLPLADAIDRWVSRDPEASVSRFFREAVREKLSRDGVAFQEEVR